MRVLVTGAAGFIASSLIPRLLREGHQVVGVDNLSFGKPEHVQLHQGNPNFRFIRQDLLDREATVRLFQGIEPVRVWHLAANSDISRGTLHTDFDLKGGTILTSNVLEAMRLCKCPEIIFSSSGSIYGEPAVHPTPEGYGPLFPISLYAASKLACEGLISAFAHNYGLKAWIFRFGNIIGPHPTHGVIHDFVRRLKEDPSTLMILGDGLQAKPYVHVEDCLDGMMFGHAWAPDRPVHCYNLAVPDQTTVTQIAEWTLEEMGIQNCQLSYTGGTRGWSGDVPFVDMDTSCLAKLGWKPAMNSGQAVRRAIREIIEGMNCPKAAFSACGGGA